jgi:2-oxoglutarate dehydrogenase E1 component
MSAGPKPVRPSVNSWNADYLEEQFERYQSDPGSVTPDLQLFFQGFELALGNDLELPEGAPSPLITAPSSPRFEGATGTTGDEAIVEKLIQAYRDLGHLGADLDPLERSRDIPEPLNPAYYGLADSDLDREVDATTLGLTGRVTIRAVVEHLRSIYCGSIGAEFMHILDTEQREWLLDQFEGSGRQIVLSRQERVLILELLTRSDSFERFLGKRYPGDKRFSLEGSESLIPLTEWILMTATEHDVEEVVLGMAHRGRLNVLNNILGKTYQQVFTEFEESWDEDFVDGGGDVKYHQGYSGTRQFPNGRMLHLAMSSNPSHLESVDPVVMGRCRAKQRLRGDHERRRVIPLLMHGDAAVIGQGIVAECLNLYALQGYTVGGTIHIVVNNQIGFTTSSEDSRSTRYCTDAAKMIDAPVFHVNGDDPEACIAIARIALEYRQKFKRDVFIDMWCYRKYGHNEQDEQTFTQPLLAKAIRAHKGVLANYASRLLGEGVINDADIQAIKHRLAEALEQAQVAARETPDDPTIDPGSERWQGISNEFSFDPVETSVSRETLEEVCAALGHVPEGFNLNRKLKPLLKARASLLETGEISYADAETLAYATLLIERHPIRMTGQDVRRGTFSHRHAVLRDAETGESYTPLNNIRTVDESSLECDPADQSCQAKLCIYDSPLSEASVLGFDYGYSLADPRMLVLWEAQFGDFVNGAQVIIDQYIASAEAKWERWSGLVMLLPHGYEGAGPEHSSCRMERFLELCGHDNIQVVYPSTAGQTFHMLRRQVHRSFRKPLIVMTPKSMLRIPTGHINDLMNDRFHEMLDDPYFADDDSHDRSKVTRVILCCGKIYWELKERREKTGRTDIAIVRIEQVYPFHADLLREVLEGYPKDAKLMYVQEEPYNAGAFLFVSDKLQAVLGLDRPEYVGRPESGSPATGSKRLHKSQQDLILTRAVGPAPSSENKPGEKLAASA